MRVCCTWPSLRIRRVFTRPRKIARGRGESTRKNPSDRKYLPYGRAFLRCPVKATRYLKAGRRGAALLARRFICRWRYISSTGRSGNQTLTGTPLLLPPLPPPRSRSLSPEEQQSKTGFGLFPVPVVQRPQHPATTRPRGHNSTGM